MSPQKCQLRLAARRRLLVSSAYSDPQMLNQFGKEAYSYRIVLHAFRGLLEQWGEIVEVENPEDNLPHAVTQAEAEGWEPLHLSFLPPQLMTICEGVANVGVPAWEFPDIPTTDLAGMARHNWLTQSHRMAGVITHTDFSRQALLRGGVRTPIAVIPVPVSPEYFHVPAWDPQRRIVLNCPCYDFRPCTVAEPVIAAEPEIETVHAPVSRTWVGAYRQKIKPYLPKSLAWGVNATRRGAIAVRQARLRRPLPPPPASLPPPFPITPQLELSGVVYTTILNHVDGRKNWPDILTAFVTAMKDRPDATLVVKLVTRPENERAAIQDVAGYYTHIATPHQCRVVFVTEYLSSEQMVQLAEGTTFYLNASKAEGSCLPLQDFLAAGRPAVAPAHTGMSDVHDPAVGFVLETHPEPICFPQDPEMRLTTYWQRLVWPSLVSRLQESFRVATTDRRRFDRMANTARTRLQQHASLEQVCPTLLNALDDALRVHHRREVRPNRPVRRAA